MMVLAVSPICDGKVPLEPEVAIRKLLKYRSYPQSSYSLVLLNMFDIAEVLIRFPGKKTTSRKIAILPGLLFEIASFPDAIETLFVFLSR